MLLIRWSKFSANQKHYQDLGSDWSSVWNFYAHFPEVILWGNQWRCRKMLTFLSTTFATSQRGSRLHLTQWQNLHLGPLDWGLVHSSNHSTSLEILQMLNPWVSQATNINFLLTKSIRHQGKRLWELTKWSPKPKCFHLPSNSLLQFLRKIYGHQSGEFVHGNYQWKESKLSLYTYFIFWLSDKWSWLEILDGVVNAPSSQNQWKLAD